MVVVTMDKNLSEVLGSYVHGMSRVKSQSELEKLFVSASKALGFDFAAYGSKKRSPFNSHEIEFVTNYPSQWQNRYIEDSLFLDDPLIPYALTNCSSTTWEPLFDRRSPFWQEACGYGVEKGWSHPIHSPDIITLVSFSRSKEAISDKELSLIQPYLLWLSISTDQGFKHLLSDNTAKFEALLTCREVEVLKWCADGKSQGETATLLGIANKTVEFHMANAVNKLGASNSTGAAVRAILMGLI